MIIPPPRAPLAPRLGLLLLSVMATAAATGADAIERRLPPPAPPIAELVAKLDDGQRAAWEQVPQRSERKAQAATWPRPQA